MALGIVEDVVTHQPGPTAGPAAGPHDANDLAPARARRRRRVDWPLLLSGLPLLLILGFAFFPGVFTSQDPLNGIATQVMQGPSGEHWFGTDHLGRDVFARVVYGTSQTFLTAGLAVLVGLVVGSALGLASATLGRWVDPVIMRLIDVLLAIPSFLIALIIVTASEPGPISLGIGVGIGSIATFARLTRTEVMRIRALDYVEAAHLNGGNAWSVARRHVVPNAAGQILSLLVVDFGVAILAISSLGFLGFGAPPPTPEWGLIIAEGRQYLGAAWWMTTLPGLVIVLTVVLLGIFGRCVQKQLRF